MPLVGYHLIGFEDGPIAFNPTDYKLLRQPEHRERTEAFFSRAPHRFNLIFRNSFLLRHANHHGERQDIGTEWLLHGRLGGPVKMRTKWNGEEELNLFLDGNRSLLDPDAINFIYMSNATSNPVIPLTPHMMAHRMGHLHMQVREDGRLYDWLVDWSIRMLNLAYEYQPEQREIYAWGAEPAIDALWINAIYKSLCTTRAGRNRQVMAWEYIPEWVAQWINKGRIVVPELPRVLDLQYIFQNDNGLQKNRISGKGECLIPEGQLARRYNYPTEMFAHALAQRYNWLMHKWTGEMIVT